MIIFHPVSYIYLIKHFSSSADPLNQYFFTTFLYPSEIFIPFFSALSFLLLLIVLFLTSFNMRILFGIEYSKIIIIGCCLIIFSIYINYDTQLILGNQREKFYAMCV